VTSFEYLEILRNKVMEKEIIEEIRKGKQKEKENK
jgi:hypothetical protein